jgi:hypothetical protein
MQSQHFYWLQARLLPANYKIFEVPVLVFSVSREALGPRMILLTLVKTELCGQLLVVLTLSRFSCTAGFFLASLIIQP